jgi:hypothetical protein
MTCIPPAGNYHFNVVIFVFLFKNSGLKCSARPNYAAMKPKDVIRRPKVVTKPGEWKVVTGKAKMPAGAFPLSRSFSVQLGRGWHWRVDHLAGGGTSLRILISFNLDIEQYRAWLAMPRGDANVIVAQLEFHGDHPGWHCHVACCDLEDVEVGQGRPRSAARIPGSSCKHRRQTFDMTESAALARAFNFFRVTGTPEGAMI